MKKSIAALMIVSSLFWAGQTSAWFWAIAPVVGVIKVIKTCVDKTACRNRVVSWFSTSVTIGGILYDLSAKAEEQTKEAANKGNTSISFFQCAADGKLYAPEEIASQCKRATVVSIPLEYTNE